MFAYFAFLMAESEVPVPDAVVWSFLDVDADGCLNDNEFRTLVAHILHEDAFYGDNGDDDDDGDDDEEEEQQQGNAGLLPKITEKSLKAVSDTIWSEARSSSLVPIVDACVTLRVLKRAKRAFASVSRSIRDTMKRTRPTYELADANVFSSFAALTDKPSSVLRVLDGLRSRPTKFICINDDTTAEQTKEQAEQVDKALHLFLESLFPQPSPYELDGASVGNAHNFARNIIRERTAGEDMAEREGQVANDVKGQTSSPTTIMTVLAVLLVAATLGLVRLALKRGLLTRSSKLHKT